MSGTPNVIAASMQSIVCNLADDAQHQEVDDQVADHDDGHGDNKGPDKTCTAARNRWKAGGRL